MDTTNAGYKHATEVLEYVNRTAETRQEITDRLTVLTDTAQTRVVTQGSNEQAEQLHVYQTVLALLQK